MKTLILNTLSIFLFFVGSVLAGDHGEYPFYFTNDSRVSGIKNEMQMLHGGLMSFQKRIDLIRKAKKSIKIEYFIWEKDKAGLLLTHELLKRVKDGIKIQILLDESFTVLELDEFSAEVFKEKGLDFRLYNRAIDPVNEQRRTHRKILVIDGEEGITGGRNIGDDYFAFDEVYNFLDRDIYFRGPVAKAMEDSFDAFWEDSKTVTLKPVDSDRTARRISRGRDRTNRDRYNNVRGRRNDERLVAARKWVEEREGMDEVAKQLEDKTRAIIDSTPIYNCPKLTYASDSPRDRVLRNVLYDFIYNKTKGDFILASPYFMLNKRWENALEAAMKKEDVNPIVFTNSLGSTDAFYVASNFYSIAFDWAEAGLNLWVHDSRFDNLYPTLNEKVSAARWGMHEKTQVFSDTAFYIGTFNIDNRSDVINVEMGVFCEDAPELTADLKKDMEDRIKLSYKILSKDKAETIDGSEADVYGNASEGQYNIMKWTSPLSKLFEFLM